MVRIVLGNEIEKPKWVTRSHWDDRRLTPDQVRYAFIDAYDCLKRKLGRAAAGCFSTLIRVKKVKKLCILDRAPPPSHVTTASRYARKVLFPI